MTDEEMKRLDRLMAEKCMGWHPADYGWWRDDEWQPTRDIAQAMKCAEKCGKQNQFKLLFQMDFWGSEKQYWTATFGNLEEFQKTADTPALAICLAIEKYLEGKQP